MTTMMTENKERVFYVVHPLDDQPEEKRNVDDLGPMPMSASVKYSLFALRGYLIMMAILVVYRVLTMAGALGHHFH